MKLLAMLAIVAALTAAQQSPEQILQEAIAAHRGGDLDAAIRGYRSYLQVRPESLDARSNLGAALASTGRYSEAILEYRKALNQNPGSFPVRMNLALAYYKSEEIPKASELLAALHREQPHHKQVILLLGDCLLRQGEDQKVIELLTPVEKQDDDLAVAYMLGTALLRAKRTQAGERVMDRILRRGDSAEARLLLGTAKYNALEYQEALVDLRKAAELNPRLPSVYSYLGRAEMDSGDMDAARAAFEKELAHNPIDFEANLNLAVLLKQQQEYARARKLLDRALVIRPGELRALYQVGSIDLATGKLDSARAIFEGIVKRAPHFIEAHISLATVYYRLKRKQDGDRERAIVQKLRAEKDAAEARSNPQ